MTRKYIFLLIALVVVLIFYLYPNPKRGLKELYRGDERDRIASLDSFRLLPLKSLDDGGAQWKYLVAGDGEESILFLHGMAGSYDIWWQQILAMKGKYKVIALTYPPASSLRQMGAAIIKVLDAEHIEQTHVVGSSLGGYFAQYLKTTYPDRFKKAVLANTFPPNDVYKEKNATMAIVARFLPEWMMMIAFRNNVRKVVLPASENPPLVEAYLLEQSYGGMSKEQFLARYDCVVDKFTPAASLGTSADILIVESDNDPLVSPELRERLKTIYPSADVYTFHNQGHFPYLNDTKQYNALIKDFFERP